MVILGLVQGLTEFLPVSSTAHLIFTEAFLGIRRPGILLESILHLGTVVSALVLLWNDVKRLLAGAGVFGLKDLRLGGALGYSFWELLAGFGVAVIAGAIAIRWLMGIVRRGRLAAFAGYCVVVGIAVLVAAARR